MLEQDICIQAVHLVINHSLILMAWIPEQIPSLNVVH